MKKKLMTAAAVATIGVAGLSTGAAFAVSDSSNSTDPMGGLVSAIASKFKLKTSDVQAVFDEQRSAMEAQREQETKDKVAALVKEGKLTQSQGDAINAKRAELNKERDADRDSMKDKTDAERKTAMDAKKAELDAWLKEKDIDQAYAYLLMGGGHGHGPGGPGRMGGPRDNDDSDSASSS